METLNIETGEKRIAINGDPSRVIVFNPHDIGFAERFFAVLDEFEKKLIEYRAQHEALEADQTKDKNGLPANLKSQVELLREVCQFIKGKIDYAFGDDTAQIAFGDSMVIESYIQFFDGIMPYITKARNDNVSKYIVKKARAAPAQKGKSRKRK